MGFLKAYFLRENPSSPATCHWKWPGAPRGFPAACSCRRQTPGSLGGAVRAAAVSAVLSRRFSSCRSAAPDSSRPWQASRAPCPVTAEFDIPRWRRRGGPDRRAWSPDLPRCPWAVKDDFWRAVSDVTGNLVGLSGNVLYKFEALVGGILLCSMHFNWHRASARCSPQAARLALHVPAGKAPPSAVARPRLSLSSRPLCLKPYFEVNFYVFGGADLWNFFCTERRKGGNG